MSEFIRVHAVDGPKHEFHAALAEVQANPHLYKVIDSTVVSQPEPPTYVETTPPKSPSKTPKAPKTPPAVTDDADAKPVGDTDKEND